jgi:hypothetical protein
LRERATLISFRGAFDEALVFVNPSLLSGLVAQLVEQCPFNSNRPILAIFSPFLFSPETIANPLISLVIFHF